MICMENQSVNIFRDKDGQNVVLINDIKFRTRRIVDWKYIEEYLKEYIGKHYEILETSEKVYIGSDFPDEFCHSRDKISLKGANEKAKANIISAIGELINTCLLYTSQRLRANEKAHKEPAVSSARLLVGEDIPKKTYKFLLSG